LSQDERIEIADLRRAGLSTRHIGGLLGRAPSTISRELRRNAAGGRGYRPFEADRRAMVRRVRHHRRRIETSLELRQVIGELLGQVSRPAGDVVVSREHLSGGLSAGLGAGAPVEAGPAASFAALYRP
jgi:IS30 family transposase